MTGARLSNCSSLLGLLTHLFTRVLLLLGSEMADSRGQLGGLGRGLKGGSGLDSGDGSHYIS